MAGWWDDWSDGKVDGVTAFGGWLFGDDSPSEVAEQKCDANDRSCKEEVTKEEVDKLYGIRTRHSS